jgi:hypothetical protein
MGTVQREYVPPPTVRSANVVYCDSGTFSHPLPSGSEEGDHCVVFAGHAASINVPTGWRELSHANGPFFSGATFTKTLEAEDIDTGVVAFTANINAWGISAAASLIGGRGWIACHDSWGAEDVRRVTLSVEGRTDGFGLQFGSCTHTDGIGVETHGMPQTVLDSFTAELAAAAAVLVKGGYLTEFRYSLSRGTYQSIVSVR